MSNTPQRGQLNAVRRRIASVLTATVAAALLVVVPTTATDASAKRVTICHQVGNLSYRPITVDVNSIGGGHGHHPGDIIPAFNAQQGNRPIHYAGRNLNTLLRAADGLTGADIVAAGCATPAPAQLTPPTSGAIATPTPVDTLAPETTVQAVPSPTETAVPPTVTTPTEPAVPPTVTEPAVPPTPTDPAVPPTVTSAPSPTLAPTATPSPTPSTAPEPTLAPPRTVAPDTTVAANCPDGELAHAGECYAVPPLVVPQTPSLLTITSQPESASLVPIVECVDTRADGIRTVWFSYESTADDVLIVERGSANQISPRGTPPRLFGPGLHVFVVAVETTDGIALWTLAGQTATSNAQSPDCSSPVTTGGTDTTGPTPDTTPATTAPAATTPGTTEPDTTEPATTERDTTGPDTTEPATTATTEPDTGQPETTDPETTGPTPEGTCAPGETLTDGTCTPVEPVRLVLVDNVLECDGHGIARFAAFNDNVFALEADNATTFVSPQRLAAEAPEVIDERDVVSDDGSETAALFTVRYVTAVTWSVSHHGLEASISAGVNGAAANPACPEAIVESSGAYGLLSAPGPLAATGPTDNTVPMAVLAALLSTLGLGLVMLARRRFPAVR